MGWGEENIISRKALVFAKINSKYGICNIHSPSYRQYKSKIKWVCLDRFCPARQVVFVHSDQVNKIRASTLILSFNKRLLRVLWSLWIPNVLSMAAKWVQWDLYRLQPLIPLQQGTIFLVRFGGTLGPTINMYNAKGPFCSLGPTNIFVFVSSLFLDH